MHGLYRTLRLPNAVRVLIPLGLSASAEMNRIWRSGCESLSLVFTNSPLSQPVVVRAPFPLTAQFRTCTKSLF